MKFKIKIYNDYSKENIFPDVTVDPGIIVVRKCKFDGENIISYNDEKKVPQVALDEKSWSFLTKKEYELINKIEKAGVKLKDWDINIYRGILTGLNKAFLIDSQTRKKLIKEDSNSKKFIKKHIRGRNIFRYNYQFNDEWIILIKSGWTDKSRGEVSAEKYFRNELPAIYNYLSEIGNKIRNGEIKCKGKGLFERDDQGDYWWELRECDYYDKFLTPKIIYKDISERLAFAYDNENIYFNNTVYFLDSGKKYLLAILNSKLINFYYKRNSSNLGSRASRGFKEFISEIPLIAKISQRKKDLLKRRANNIIRMKNKILQKEELKFLNIIERYISEKSLVLREIIEDSFYNKIYSGKARKVRDFTVDINTNIVTLYSDKSSSGKYELLKFEEDNKNKRHYLKYFLENLTEEKLEEINETHSGNLLKRVLQIEIPDYDKDHVVRKVVNEWESLQKEIEELEKEIEKTDDEIDQMVYDLYELTDKEIKVIEQ
ncbi:TaqI-like C-terminal specificity domain-containing protein [Halarsenatibacter silvermanii]|uniref:TaqI-like C-terminal specificity domain-containing protein n=1 Tax=Halarsenatibacter silvermanii TaxID=321763 RepID=A0A1G9J8R7_9FIRM|nr:TaqI-like C-terminal specificity domain-containing protein [Halarsenatibacter silvermanii]SDL33595.1 TaqI-like C-terminal specificity domain-containing protein [Halarsenatibacter silvermanii]